MKNVEINQSNLTEVVLSAGKTDIPAVLNDSKSSRELIRRLPFTVKLYKYEHDYCGVMKEPLGYDDNDLHNGWHNGEIVFAADGNYFTILYKDEEISSQFGNLVTLGQVTCTPDIFDKMERKISLSISLKQ
jgi:hypothetical protein